MPFCRNCGNQIPENTKFCDKCGSAQQYDSSPAPSRLEKPSTTFSDNEPKTLLSASYSNKQFNTIVICIIFIAVLGFICVYILNNKINELSEYYYKDSVAQSIQSLKNIRAFSVFIDIILAGELVLKCFQIKNNYIHITEEGVSGEGCPIWGFGTLPFKFSFKYIRNVESKNDGLLIITADKKYYCFVENASKAQMLIHNKFYDK